VRVVVHVHAGSSKPAVGGCFDGQLVVRVAQRAVDGKATAAVVVALAGAFGVPERDVKLVSGETSRTKVVDIAGGSENTLGQLLAG
jgi:uncharacterized protein (TIGR00251 family)